MITITLSDIEIELVKELEMLSKMSIDERNIWLRKYEDCSKDDYMIIHEYIGLMQALVIDISVKLECKGVDMECVDIKRGFLK